MRCKWLSKSPSTSLTCKRNFKSPDGAPESALKAHPADLVAWLSQNLNLPKAFPLESRIAKPLFGPVPSRAAAEAGVNSSSVDSFPSRLISTHNCQVLIPSSAGPAARPSAPKAESRPRPAIDDRASLLVDKAPQVPCTWPPGAVRVTVSVSAKLSPLRAVI